MTYSGMTGNPKNGGTLMVSDSAGSVFDHFAFSSSTSSSDYLSMNLVMRSTASGGNNYHFDYTLFNAGPDQITDKTWTPIVYMPPNQNGTGGLLGNQGFVFHCSNCFLNRRGIEEEAAGASIELRDISTTYRQGGITPLFMFGNSHGVAGGDFKFNLTIQDTESLPTLTFLGNPSVAQVEFTGVQNYSSDTGGIPPPISGQRPAYFYSESSNIGKIPTRGSSATGDSYDSCRVIYPYDMTGTNGCVRQDIQTFFESSHFPAQHSLFWDMAPPSSVTAVVASGGRLAVGKTYYYDVSAIDPMGGETVMANSPSAPVTMSSGNGSAYLSWTGSMGAASYNVYRCVSAGSNCVKPDGRAIISGTNDPAVAKSIYARYVGT